MKHVHKDDKKLWSFVEQVIWTFASRHDLRIADVKPVKRKNTHDRHGQCSKNGVVRLALRTFSKGRWKKRPELAYEIVDTIAHELAHLKHQEHNSQWLRLYAEILVEMSGTAVFHEIRQLTR